MSTIMTIVGARPQFIKAGPVSRAISEAGLEEVLVHTGQHYDSLMSDLIMQDVGLRDPDVNLAVGSGPHGEQTARMLMGLEQVMIQREPDVVVTYGDTNSTVAGALAAAKLGIFTAHVEAGLRSLNRAMPEELNRVVTDHLSDLLLAPTQTALSHLHNEGLDERAVLTGDVMVDALRSVDLMRVHLPAWARGDFLCATLHRAENTDDRGRLSDLIKALDELDIPVHLLAHPRLVARLQSFGLEPARESLILHEPLPYGQMLATIVASRGLLTDSGGLQKEAFILRVPCVTLRRETEWPETLQGSWNILASPDLSTLQEQVHRVPSETASEPFGSGNAATQIISALQEASGI